MKWIKIIKFGFLKDGWDFGEGYASNWKTILKALFIYWKCVIYNLKVDAFPGVNGGINVVFYASDHSIEIRVKPDGTLNLIHEVGIGLDFDTIEDIEDVNEASIDKRLVYLSKLETMDKII